MIHHRGTEDTEKEIDEALGEVRGFLKAFGSFLCVLWVSVVNPPG